MNRIKGLDALRGLAALVVVFHHCAMLTTTDVGGHVVLRSIESVLLRLGHPAVLLFFVMSGFVLALPWVQGKKSAYIDFLIKRIARIFPALVFSILLSCILYWMVAPVATRDVPWSSVIWIFPPDTERVLRHIALFVINPTDIDLNGAIWSLAYELRISLLMPMIAVCAVAFPRVSAACAFLALIVMNLLLHKIGGANPLIFGSSFKGAVFATVLYAKDGVQNSRPKQV